MAFDPHARRVLLFGGWQGSPWSSEPFVPFCQTWSFDGRQWERLGTIACITDRLRNNSLVYDSRLRTMLLVDGVPEIPPADTVRPLRVWRWSNTAWELVDSVGPRRKSWVQAVYDVSRAVLVIPVFDGPDASVWEWDGRRWRHVLARGPSNRQAYALAYDSRRRQIVLVGGQTLVRPSSYIGDAWSWDGRRWSPIVSDPQRSPGPRAGATLLDDPHNGRLLYFGGYTGPPFRAVQELWYLTRHGWQPSNP